MPRQSQYLPLLIVYLLIKSVAFAQDADLTEESDRLQGQDRPAGYDRVREFLDAGEADRAVEFADSLRVDWRDRYGEDSLEYAHGLDAWLVARSDHGNRAAEELLVAARRSLDIRESVLAAGDAEIGRGYYMLGVIQRGRGETENSIESFLAAVAIYRETGPPDKVAQTTNSLAIAYATLGQFDQARPAFERSLEIWEETLGPDDPDVGRGYNNLATLYRILGEYELAIERFDRAIEIFEKAYGPNHLTLASPLAGRGGLLANTARLEPARRDFERALRLRTAGGGPIPWQAAYEHTGLGLVGMYQGQYQEAWNHFDTSARLFEEGNGPDHHLVAYSLFNRGLVEHRMSRNEQAIETLSRAWEIRVAALGEENPSTAQTEALLCYVELQEGSTPELIARLENCRDRLEAGYGPANLKTGDVDQWLAVAQMQVGNYEAASIAIERSIAGLAELQWEGQFHAGRHLTRGRIRSRGGETALAMEDALYAERLSREFLRTTLQVLSESAGAQFAETRANGLGLALSVALRDPATVEPAWDALIQSRSLQLDEQVERRQAVARSRDPRIQELASEVFAARTLLANLFVRGAQGDEARYEQGLRDAESNKRDAEAALAQASAGFRSSRAAQAVGLNEVRIALEPGDALVAYARFPQDPGDVSYDAALVLRADQVSLFDLGPAERTDALVERWRRTVADGNAPDGPVLEQSLRACRAAGEELRQHVWDPIAESVADARNVFVVPDGTLHLVPLGALPVGEESWLIEGELVLHTLGAERELVVDSAGPEGVGMLACGGVDFDFDASSATAVASTGGQDPTAGADSMPHELAVLRGLPADCERFRSLEFVGLDQSAKECEELGTIWSSRRADEVVLLQGEDASEGVIKRMVVGRDFVHLATHGYFLGEDCRGGEADARASDPLVLSGLALSGANHRALARPNEEDGILTAEEVALLDLSGVGWVVLSACDTGLGQIVPGEGVYGLQRAFRGAGARTVVMSLWPVDDALTRRWMGELYEARLARDASAPLAVRSATRSVLAQLRAEGVSEHPYRWAGFIAVGDWR